MGLISRVSSRTYRHVDKFNPDQRLTKDGAPQKQGLWDYWVNGPAGIKTVHFWAPAWKWVLVMATVGDYGRHPSKCSMRGTTTLAATGIIWSRYSLVVIPKNWTLFSVNFVLGLTGMWQFARLYKYRQENNLPLFS